jgi:PAS domain S-box-containing protein
MSQVRPELASEALRAEQARYQELFEFAPVSYLVTDSNGLILEANRAAGGLLGVPSDRLVGKPIAVFIPVQHRKQFRKTLLGLVEARREAEWELELLRRDGTPDGTVFEAQLNAAPDQEGGLRWMLQDVTERVASAQRLRTLASALEERVLERTEEVERQRAHLEAIVAQLPVGLVIMDASSEHAVTMNDEARRVLEPFDRAMDQLPFDRALVDGEVLRGERLEFAHPRHGPLTLQFSAAPVRDRSGRIDSAVVIIQDITGEERRERAEREFVANAAHELQSPLAAITSAVEVLQAGAKDTPDRDLFLKHIEREASRLGRIVRALLTLARAQTRVEPPRMDLIELCPMLERIADRMEPMEGVELVVECPIDLAVLANPDLLEQAVSNVVRNAVKHTTEGSIRLSGSSMNEHVAIRVTDTGSGISGEVLPRVFDRFYHADAKPEGFGLGLAIVDAAVDAMRGRLDVESTVGRGTTITITLPSRATLVGARK